jgi:GTP-binding protein HflX
MAKVNEKLETRNEKWTPTAPLFISAKNKENIDELREVLYAKVRELHVQKYPYNDFLYTVED